MKRMNEEYDTSQANYSTLLCCLTLVFIFLKVMYPCEREGEGGREREGEGEGEGERERWREREGRGEGECISSFISLTPFYILQRPTEETKRGEDNNHLS